MSTQAKLILPVVLFFVVYAIILLLPSDDLGSFDSVRASGEINQSVNVMIDKSRDFERDRFNNIVAFYALDKHNKSAKIGLEEPAPKDLENALVVELFGHMHGDNFICKRLTIVKMAG